MTAYNWSNLSDFDFENVCRDVMTDIVGHRVESFSRGRDGGIDLRWHDEPAGYLVVGQAKHFSGSSYSSLLSALKREKVKVDKFSSPPNRYLLFTSQPLTPNRKTEIVAALSPYVVAPSDVIGLEDLEGFLASRPELESHHYKLWLSSARVIDKIVGNATAGRSRLRVSEILDRARLFVPHEKFDDAVDILKAEHNLIISGEAGIGKTTLAEMLTLRLLANDYTPHFVASVDELEGRMVDDARQLFIYDDFLGRTNLQAGAGSQERLFTVMRHIGRSKHQYLILTTREYLYKEARVANERLAASRADVIRCVLDVHGYTRTVRAQILYNHLFWTGGIPLEALQEFVAQQGYWAIIDHTHFNPRWIADTLNVLAVQNHRDSTEETWT